VAIGTRATLLIAAFWFILSSLTLVSMPSIRQVRSHEPDLATASPR
jgi:hypothetical protein